MTALLFSFFSALLFYCCFTGLHNVPLSKLCGFILIFQFFILDYFIPDTFKWITILYALSASIIVFFGNGRKLSDVIYSLIGYLVAMTLNHLCIVSLNLTGLTIESLYAQPVYGIIFIIFRILLIIVLLRLIRWQLNSRNYFYLDKYPDKIQILILIELYIEISIMTLNFVYGDINSYYTEILMFNGVLVGFFTLSTVVIFFAFYHVLQRNYELTLAQKNQEALNNYLERIEEFYENIRVFRHDYANILSTMHTYMKDGDWDKLREHFETNILPSKQQLKDTDFLVGKLNNMKIPEIKSILYTKLIAAANAHLNIILELKDPIYDIYMDSMKLARILGIMLDNAIEAAKETEEACLHIAVISTETRLLFCIENSTPPLSMGTEYLFAKDVTTKKDHSGLGLYNLRSLVDSTPNAAFSLSCQVHFNQTLEICNNIADEVIPLKAIKRRRI